MRTAPSLSVVTGTDYYTFYRNSAGDNFNSFTIDSSTTTDTVQFYNNSEISGTAGHGGAFSTNNASSFLAFVAEL